MRIRLSISTVFAISVLSVGYSPVLAQSAESGGNQIGSPPQSREAVPPGPTDQPQGPTSENPLATHDQTPPVQENVIPAEPGAAATTSTDANEGLLPGSVDGKGPGFQRDVVPQTTEKERSQGGQSGGQSEVQPDVVPDRRFETFDSDKKGTPEMEKMPESDVPSGGTYGLPPGGYGIGGRGQ